MKGLSCVIGKRVALLLLWTVVIVVLSLLPGRAVSTAGWLHTLHVDKAAHMFMYGLWAILAWFALRVRLGYIVVAAILLGAVMECLQAYVTVDRKADIADMLFNAIGAVLTAVFIHWKTRGHDARHTQSSTSHSRSSPSDRDRSA